MRDVDSIKKVPAGGGGAERRVFFVVRKGGEMSDSAG